MEIHDLARAYQAKTDEELLHLAEHPAQLTPEAHATLKNELAKRRIESAEHSTVHAEEDRGRIDQPSTRGTILAGSQGAGEFVAEVLCVYHDHFWFFVKLVAPAVVVGYIAVLTGRNEAREIARHLPRGVELLGHRIELLEIGLANFAGYLVSWTAFSFSFGAISLAVHQIEVSAALSVADSFGAVRERMSAFLRLSLLLFFLLLVGIVSAELLSGAVLWILQQRQSHLSFLTIQVVSVSLVGVVLLLLSRFGLAIPALVLDNCRVGQAMFRSDELTERKWLILGVLLGKSLIGGYLAGMCPFWLASWIPSNVRLPIWFPWVLTIASIGGVTVVEPTMFIGFALLYPRMAALFSTSSAANARQLV